MSDLAEDRLRSVEDRLTRVETRLDGLTTRIDEMDRHIAARFDDMNRHIATRFDDVHGRLNDLNTTMHTITAKLPTWWQFPAAISGVMAVGATIYGVLSYLHLHGSI
jgi:hypothetical protein